MKFESFPQPTPEMKPPQETRSDGDLEKRAEPRAEDFALGITEAQKEQVAAYLEKELASEDKIAEPMDSDCKVSVVIPAYGERGYILRPIESLATQEGVDPNEYELIVVVNNPSESPAKSAKETDADFERKIAQYRLAVKENQETLKLIGFINGEDTDAEIGAQEKEIIERIKALGLRVRAIDKASPGKTLPKESANVGGARNRGVAEAVARFLEQNKNGIIAQSDADTRFDIKYIRNLIEIFKKRPELVGLVGKLDLEPEYGDRLVSLTSLYGDMKIAYTTLIDDLGKRESNFEDTEEVRFFEHIHFSGANMASRAVEAALVGGVPKIAGGEDPGFGERLSDIGVIDRVPEVVVSTADRFSARTDVDAGEGQRKIKLAESLEEVGTVLVTETPESAIAVRNLRRELVKAIKTHDTTPQNLKRILSYKDEQLLSDEELEVLSRELTGVKYLSEIVQNEKAVALGKKAVDKITGNVEKKSIEVGNVFHLGTKFSEPLGLSYKDESGNITPVVMGSYGFGPTRLMGTIVEVLSDEKGIVWPEEVAPFKFHLLNLSTDDEAVNKDAQALYDELTKKGAEVLYDDSSGVSAAEKFKDSYLLGVPYRIVVSKKTLAEGKYELKNRTETSARLVGKNELFRT